MKPYPKRNSSWVSSMPPAGCDGASEARLYRCVWPEGEPKWQEVKVRLSDLDVYRLSRGGLIFLTFLDDPADPVNSDCLKLVIGKDLPIRDCSRQEATIDPSDDPGLIVNKALKRIRHEVHSLFEGELDRLMDEIRANHGWQEIKRMAA